ncbi:MAG: hypothetical protein KAI08_03155 [Bacteroidales bacterium]|nr:hypothetical protein [Bacteroidales bacterium]
MYKPSSKSALIKNLSNIPGWRTRRKLVVFESDDWGSIRTPSLEALENLQKDGIDLQSDAGHLYNNYDSLATTEDLASLFEVLNSVKDSSGRPAVFTPESVVANPDFDRIRQADYREYFYEPFTETLLGQAHCEGSFDLWQEGREKRLFVPQFHGREHLNVPVWMRALQAGLEGPMSAFKNKMWGISTADDPRIGLEFQAAFDFNDPDDLSYHQEVLVSGLHLFEKLFGYRASYFVPPNGLISSTLEPVCAKEGIQLLSVSKIHREPVGQGKQGKKLHWLGQRNGKGLIYLTRNCFFEPVEPGRDWVDHCLYDISSAFKWHKPALISSHRVNYIGALHQQNRDNGLKLLQQLIKQIVSKWPEAEFVTSAELGEIIKHG